MEEESIYGAVGGAVGVSASSEAEEVEAKRRSIKADIIYKAGDWRKDLSTIGEEKSLLVIFSLWPFHDGDDKIQRRN